MACGRRHLSTFSCRKLGQCLPDESLANGPDLVVPSGTALSADAATVSPDSARRVRSRDNGRLRRMPIITECARMILRVSRSGKIIWR